MVHLLTLVLLVAGLGLLLFSVLSSEHQFDLLSHWASDGSVDVEISHPMFGLVPALGGGMLILISLVVVYAVYKADACSVIVDCFREWSLVSCAFYARICRAVGDETRTHLTLLALIGFVGLGLRIFAMSLPAQYDESVNATDLAQMPLLVALTKYTGPGNHLFQTAMSNLSWKIFGESTTALRLPVFLFGIACLPMSYILIRKVFCREAALIGTALLATNHYLVSYSADARGYAVVCTAFIVVLFLVFRVSVRRSFDHVDALSLYASTVICLYTLPSMLYGVIPSYIAIALSLRDRNNADWLTHELRFVKTGIASVITLVVGYGITFLHTPFAVWRELPTIKTKLDRLPINEVINGNVDKWREFVDRFVWVFPEGVGEILLVLPAIGFVVAVVRHRKIAIFIGLFCGSAVLVLLMQRVVPFARTWTFCIPIIAGLLGLAVSKGIERVGSNKPREMLVMIVVVVILSMTTFRCKELLVSSHMYPDGARVGSFLKEQFRPGEDYLVVPGFDIVPLNFYLYTKDIFEVRKYGDYPVSMLLDHFRGKDTHRDWYSFQTASGQYTAAGHEYQRGYRNIKDAVRIFFVLRKSVNAEEMFRDHPVGYDEPRIIKRYRNVDIWLSTAN